MGMYERDHDEALAEVARLRAAVERLVRERDEARVEAIRNPRVAELEAEVARLRAENRTLRNVGVAQAEEIERLRGQAPRWKVGDRVVVNRTKHPFFLRDRQNAPVRVVIGVKLIEYVTVDDSDGMMRVYAVDDLEPAPPEEPSK